MTISNNKLLVGAAGAGGGAGLNVEEVFQTHVYTGTGSSNSSTQNIINNIDLSGEGGLVWIKDRGTKDHFWFDTERGATKYIRSNNNDSESSPAEDDVSAFLSNGFTVRGDNNTNGSGDKYCSWTFRKTEKFFDIVTYTGNGTQGRTISHNLGSAPGMYIVKRRDSAASADWAVYHRGLTSALYGLKLNSNTDEFDADYYWDSTDPTDSVFSVGNNSSVNADGGTYVAYLFAHNNDDGGFGPDSDQDIIKCGSFTGGGDVAVNLGFEPQWVLTKYASGSNQNWFIHDSIRGFTADPIGQATLEPNNTDAEDAGKDSAITSTGFRSINTTSGGTYIYVAIRRGPMAVPTSASDFFDIDLANSGSTTITTPFPVDFSLTAKRDGSAGNFGVVDRIRGGKGLRTNSTNTDQNVTVTLDSMNSFSNGAFGSGNHVFYTWKRAPSHLDVVAYTGTGSARTVSHNLTVEPEMIWIKNRDNADDWAVYYGDNTDYLNLNHSYATADSASRWNDTSPTSSVFTVGTDHSVNASGEDYIAYLFATLSGVSKIGSYTGNGGSGTTGNTQNIDCGFSNGAKFVLIKPTNANDSWLVFDTERGISSGGNDPYLPLNEPDQEIGGDNINPYSAGFTVVQHGNGSTNLTGREYIFYAVAT